MMIECNSNNQEQQQNHSSQQRHISDDNIAISSSSKHHIMSENINGLIVDVEKSTDMENKQQQQKQQYQQLEQQYQHIMMISADNDEDHNNNTIISSIDTNDSNSIRFQFCDDYNNNLQVGATEVDAAVCLHSQRIRRVGDSFDMIITESEQDQLRQQHQNKEDQENEQQNDQQNDQQVQCHQKQQKQQQIQQSLSVLSLQTLSNSSHDIERNTLHEHEKVLQNYSHKQSIIMKPNKKIVTKKHSMNDHHNLVVAVHPPQHHNQRQHQQGIGPDYKDQVSCRGAQYAIEVVGRKSIKEEANNRNNKKSNHIETSIHSENDLIEEEIVEQEQLEVADAVVTVSTQHSNDVHQNSQQHIVVAEAFVVDSIIIQAEHMYCSNSTSRTSNNSNTRTSYNRINIDIENNEIIINDNDSSCQSNTNIRNSRFRFDIIFYRIILVAFMFLIIILTLALLVFMADLFGDKPPPPPPPPSPPPPSLDNGKTNKIHDNNDTSFDITNVPTSSPSFIRESISDQMNLVQAVDEYLLLYIDKDDHNNDNDEGNNKYINISISPMNSIRYGKIEYWDVSNITDFSNLFSMDRNINNKIFNGDISKWNTSNAIIMNDMFLYANDFDCNLLLWDFSNVIDVVGMFAHATSFHGYGLEEWNVFDNINDMSYTFTDALEFNINVSKWNVSNIVSMDGTFHLAEKFEGIGIEYWDANQLSNFSYTFSHATSFIGDVSTWNVSNVLLMDGTFNYARNFNSNLTLWDVSNVISMEALFSYAGSFIGDGLEYWNVSRTQLMSRMFMGTKKLLSDIDLSKWDVSNVEMMQDMFYMSENFVGNGLSYWDVRKVYDFSFMLSETLLFNINLSSWDVSNAIEMNGMFCNTSSFIGIGLEYWDVSNVISMHSMFQGTNINVSLVNWDVSNVTSMSFMFANTKLFNSNLSKWNVSAVLDMKSLFANTTNFQGIGLDQWILNKNVNIKNIFCNATALDERYIRNWNISSSTNTYC